MTVDLTKRTDELTLTLVPAAKKEMAAIFEHNRQIGRYYGTDSIQYLEAANSLLYCLERLFAGFGSDNTKLMKDCSDLGLYGNALGEDRWLHDFGMIFRRVQRGCTLEGCHAVINDNGSTWSYGKTFPILEHEHVPSFPLDAPHPGTWSLNT